MPYWLFVIVFWGIILLPFVLRVVGVIAIGNVYEAIARKPAPPATPVETQEETAKRRAHDLKDIARIIKARQAHQN